GDAIRILIVHTLEETLKFPIVEKEFQAARPNFIGRIEHSIEAPGPYPEFVERAIRNRNSAIITFNYDLAIDHAILKAGLEAEYYLDGGGAKTGIPLLKLHGSLNWGACAKCHKAHAVKLDQTNAAPPIADFFPYRVLPSNFRGISCCDSFDVVGPMIVPPTW